MTLGRVAKALPRAITLVGRPKLVIFFFFFFLFFFIFMTDVHVTFRCHNYDLDSPLDRETGLDIFKVDPEYEQHEAEYQVGCVFGNLHVLHHHCYAVLSNKPMTCYVPM